MTEPDAIDCDVHPTVPDNTALLPYLDEFWRDSVISRGITSLESISYPTPSSLTAPSACRQTGRLRSAKHLKRP